MDEAGVAQALAATLERLGATEAAARSVVDELVARHREHHRRHHDLSHVVEVLAEADRLLAVEPAADPVAVHLAAWFHDAIYDPTAARGGSEADSASLAQDRLPPLALADRDQVAAEVERLVLLTAGHRVGDEDRSGAVLVDADLWILAAPVERYDRYVAEVRAEYAHVGSDAWVAGRGSLLTSFLAGRDQLFRAGDGDDRDERRRRATVNLRRELATLRP